MSSLITIAEPPRSSETPDSTFEVIARRGPALTRVGRLYRGGAYLHVAAGDFSRRVEPDRDQQPSVPGNGCVGLDTGPWPCPNFRLDRNLHSRYRLLLNSQAATHPAIRTVGALDFFCDVGVRRAFALDCRRLRMALAYAHAAFRGPGSCRLSDLLPRSFRAPAGSNHGKNKIR